MRLLAAIAAIDETHRHERAFAMNLGQDWGKCVAVLRGGGRNLAFDRQAKRIDGDMPLATLDLLRGVEAARAASLGRLDRLAVDDDRRRRGRARSSASRAPMTSPQTICVHKPLSRQA